MLLIADSGSTKTEWRLVDDAGKTMNSVITEGLNPYFITQQQIASTVEEKVLPIAINVEKVFFYGAGCGLQLKAKQVSEALDAAIQVGHPAEVAGDILGAARSLLQNRKGIACILGTGANSCFYDGRQVTDIMPSLGYLFSDWGSGTVMSKDFMALLLQEKLPPAVIEDFHDTYRIGRAQILDGVYNRPLPNRFLASFAPFLLKYSALPDLRNIIVDNFNKFFMYYVLRFRNKNAQIKVSFTGSIAYNFKPFLVDIAEEFGIVIEKIVQQPMDGLVKYHCPTAINKVDNISQGTA
jgi:N-acetylglucosamine kinase-like BadF-type ATPase